jgi:hypothetical protein
MRKWRWLPAAKVCKAMDESDPTGNKRFARIEIPPDGGTARTKGISTMKAIADQKVPEYQREDQTRWEMGHLASP